MNLLLLCDEYPPGRHGGIGTAVQLLARALVRQGHRVVVAGFYDWGYGGADRFEDEGVQVYRFRRRLASRWLQHRESLPVRAAYRLMGDTGLLQRDITLSLAQYRVFLEELIRKYHLQLAEMPDFQDYIFHIRKTTHFPRLSIPVVVKLHGSMTYFAREADEAVPDPVYQTEHRILQAAAAVASVSDYTARKTAEYLNYAKEIRVLYNGITLPVQTASAKVPGQVIFTGSLMPKKGIYQLMKAWNLVHAARPEARLLVYGKGPVQQIGALLEERARKTVHFKGHVSREVLFHALSTSEAAVFPSYAECFALAPMEAMASGTAVVYTTRSSGPELITHGINGLLADPDDVEGLAEQLLFLLGHPEKRSAIAGRGQQHVRERFGMDAIAARHILFYEQVINAQG